MCASLDSCKDCEWIPRTPSKVTVGHWAKLLSWRISNFEAGYVNEPSLVCITQTPLLIPRCLICKNQSAAFLIVGKTGTCNSHLWWVCLTKEWASSHLWLKLFLGWGQGILFSSFGSIFAYSLKHCSFFAASALWAGRLALPPGLFSVDFQAVTWKRPHLK